MKIKRLALVFLAFAMLSLCACGNAEPAEPSSPLAVLKDYDRCYGSAFGQDDVIDVKISLSEEDWKDLVENATKEAYHVADITVNGIEVKNVGFRTKGYSSLRSVARSGSDRFGFKIKFDEYVRGQTLHGLDMMVLNACFSDPSYMREYLTYAASKYLGCPTPCATYTNVYINDKLFGFYLCVESYDDSFVMRYETFRDTVLYKANSDGCTLMADDDGSGFDVNVGKDKNRSNIKDLVATLNSTTSENKWELETVLDVDSVLKAAAVNTVMGNYDSYSGQKTQNFYLMCSGGKFTYIGWDYNMSLGGYPEDSGKSVSVDISSPVYKADISERPLIGKLLAIGEYYDRYVGYVKSLMEYFSDFQGMVSGVADGIREYVKNDPSAFYTIDQFEANIKASGTDLSQTDTKNPKDDSDDSQDGKSDGVHAGTISIVDYMTQRLANLKSQLG